MKQHWPEWFERVIGASRGSSLPAGGHILDPIIAQRRQNCRFEAANHQLMSGSVTAYGLTPSHDPFAVLEILDKLRSMAGILDARVFGEEDGDITDPGVDPPKRAGCTSVIVCAVALVGFVLVVVQYLR